MALENVTSSEGHYYSDPFILSTELTDLIKFSLIDVATTVTSALGIVTNVINIYIFYHQGFKDAVTISLTSLSISDLCVNISTMLMGMCFIFEYVHFLENTIDWSGLAIVTFSWIRSMFVIISTLTTVQLSVERTLCVIKPHKVRVIVTPFKTKLIQGVFYFLAMISYLPYFTTFRLSWTWNKTTNSTMLLQSSTNSRIMLEIYWTPFLAVAVPLVSFTLITVCTCILITALHASSKFKKLAQATNSKRPDNMSSSIQQETMVLTISYRCENDSSPTQILDRARVQTPRTSTSNHDKNTRATRVVALVAIIFILCALSLVIAVNIRVILLSSYPSFEPYVNLSWATFAVVYFTGAINASVNMFLYLKASSRYKEIFRRKFNKYVC